ncbi:MAG: hypothetical protein XD40_0822 [Archaeoglobus fulgidus]|uniref:Uncharacterized protein n=1 Tax=Archaeoglobus fulgidus TaxID=2234 RepID=A0A117KUR5_ARCFL|nr:hypothetical protein [Archaeoglobus fulgidus]KUJ94001.1 MAG: hypothetical protein XD40_0822 [Archaeoglobus fulgidus]KUK07031.1 MAG: hypothetical protein XD48_0743 [Archaeoglobus fulgidus]
MQKVKAALELEKIERERARERLSIAGKIGGSIAGRGRPKTIDRSVSNLKHPNRNSTDKTDFAIPCIDNEEQAPHNRSEG